MLKEARFAERAVQLTRATQNILKVLDRAERAMPTLKTLKNIIRKKVIADSEKEQPFFKKPLMCFRLRASGRNRRMRRQTGKAVSKYLGSTRT